jgi:hypothetical protein
MQRRGEGRERIEKGNKRGEKRGEERAECR